MGSVVFLGSVDGGFRPTRQDVFEFIKQCGSKTSNNPEEVSHNNGKAVRTTVKSILNFFFFPKICLKI